MSRRYARFPLIVPYEEANRQRAATIKRPNTDCIDVANSISSFSLFVKAFPDQQVPSSSSQQHWFIQAGFLLSWPS